MTIAEAKQKHREWCLAQVGYHEAPDGSNKYADGIWDFKLYGFDAQTVPWCDVFADASFITCFGYEAGTKMTFQQEKGYAACTLSAEAYMNNGAFFKEPELNDQIFFYYGDGINHTGIVVAIDGDTIQCVEGNYSNGVSLTQYNIRNQWLIAGYGRPDWSVVASEGSDSEDHSEEFDAADSDEFDIVHPEHPADRRAFQHLEYGDGVESLGHKPLPQVKAWQALLLCWGYNLGEAGADGEFGLITKNATLQWQRQAQKIGADVEANGIVDEDDWQEIISVPCVK